MQTRVLMLTDVVGSSRLWTAEPLEMDTAMARHHSLVHAAIAEHGGWRPVDQGEGDSVFAAFSSATAALACAAQVQRSLAAEPWPTSVPLTARIAVHLGEVVERDGNLFGDPVNRCARLRALAGGGQVLLSAPVRETVRDRLPDGLGVLDLGEHRLKDLERPERVWQLTGDGLDDHFLLPTGLDASRVIAVLVTGLEESLTAREGSRAEYADLRRAHSAAVRHAVSRRAAETAVTRDGVMAVFATAAEAVRCATAIQQTLQQGRGAAEPVRVALSWGRATSVDGVWCGGSVQEAEQLCAAAGPGQILATAAVADQLSGHPEVQLLEVAPQVLDGSGSTRVVCVDWQASQRASSPLPPGAAHAVGPTLFGRQDESGALERAWQEAKAGQQRVVLVAGEPGVGKTRLVAELARTAHAEGALVLWGHCDEELAVAYQPFAEALRHWAAQVGAVGAADSPELRQLLSHAHDDGPSGSSRLGEDLEGKRQMLFQAVSDLLLQLARQRPVVLVLDDVHWATAPTLLMLRHVVRETGSAGLLLLGTYRDSELDRDHPLAHLLSDLRREPTAQRLTLRGLSVAAVEAYVEAAAGAEPDSVGPELAAELHQHTEGNAFFLQQVLRHLAESGGVVRTCGRWRLTVPVEQLGLPDGVREVVGRRLARFSAPTRKALTMAAVMGRQFDLVSLEAVLPDAGEELLDQLEEAVRTRLVDELAEVPGRFSFSHALVRQTLLAELSAARRARLHRTVGEALARQEDASPARVAYHLCAGATADSVAAAVTWTTRAMEEARNRTAFEEAVALGERAMHALDVLAGPSLAARARLLTLSAANRVLAGDMDGARRVADQAIDSARRAGAPLLLADAVYQRFRWPRLGVPEPGAADLFDEALAGLGEDPESLLARSRLLTGQAANLGFSLSQGLAGEPMARQAVQLARESGDRLAEFEALLTCGLLAMGSPAVSILQDVTEGMDQLLRAALGDVSEIQLAAGGRQPSVSSSRAGAWAGDAPMGVAVRVVAALTTGDRSAAEASIEIMRGVQERAGRLAAAWTSMWQALLDLADGHLDDAEENTAQLLEMAATDANFANSWAAQSFQIAQERGSAEELVPLIRSAVEQSPGVVALQVVLALALAEAGHADEAAPLLSELCADDLRGVPRDMVWSTSLGHLTEICLLLEDRTAAAALYDALLPFSGQILVSAWGVYCPGAADRFLGAIAALLGRHEEVDARFRAALALEEGMSAAALMARTRLWWAQALLRGGDPRRALEAERLLDQVLQTTQSRGLVAMSRTAEQARGRLGAVVGRP